MTDHKVDPFMQSRIGPVTQLNNPVFEIVSFRSVFTPYSLLRLFLFLF